ncbi:hypothetical protein TPL01_32970 [Sulfuriferula plumbiphila]|uniref:Uncharacterized protein n=2 Tax=Sulfuriferula plumbiphila TaxID=171865 RepID=A0A512LCF0_9PROT|nr:hypothetical protein SFPGR_31730 [Sulfuriferula plumbiphila]GEP32159.1 hypothetical protein TPL01_32970 [Sulfuriferula plumbiphila]
MQPHTTLRDSGIDSQHASGKRRQDVTAQPGPENGTLRRVAALDQERAGLQFQDGDGRQEQATRWVAFWIYSK